MRCHENNGLYKYKSDIVRTSNAVFFDKEKPMKGVQKKEKYNPFLRWYISSKVLETNDAKLFQEKQFVCTHDINFIPDPLPEFIKIQSFDMEWNDEQMSDERNELYCFIDGAVYFEDIDSNPRSNIYGYGGGAISIYYNKELVKAIIYPSSTRTHINVMELDQFKNIFNELKNGKIQYQTIGNQIINNVTMRNIILNEVDNENAVNREITMDEITTIHIISDSQNCINTIAQKYNTKDDIAIIIHKQICKILNQLQKHKLPKDHIQIHWVHSHDQSNYNNTVDTMAKIAAKTIQYVSNNDGQCECEEKRDGQCSCSWNPNNFISYNTIKNEINYLSNKHDDKNWNTYKLNRKNEWAQHYFK